jgi:hypothetical protein
MGQERVRVFFLAVLMALLIGVPVASAAVHEGWFVSVCPAKTEAGRIHLAFSGGRQGHSWSWIKGRKPNEINLPRRFYLLGTNAERVVRHARCSVLVARE